MREEALIITTSLARNGFASGASLRTAYLKRALESLDFNVTVVSKYELNAVSKNRYKVIVVTSYACANVGIWARKRTDFLWFDPYDSWLMHRLSMLRHEFLRNLVGLIRDHLWISLFPRCELITFISQQDASRHARFARRANTLIVPIHFELPKVAMNSDTNLVFVGDGAYLPNVICLTTLNEIGKQMGMRVKVIGRNFEKHSKHYEFLSFLGYCDSSEIYFINDIHISPSEVGTGIKTKTALPLALGLRVVSSDRSANGFNKLDNLKIAKSLDEYRSGIMEFIEKNAHFTHQDYASIYEKDDSETLLSILGKI